MRTIQCTSFYPSYCSYGQRLPYYKALHYDEYSIIISCQHIHKRVKETDLLYNDNHPSTLVALTARITKNSIRIVEGISPVLIFPSPIGVAEQKLAASSHDPTPQILRWSKTQDFFEEKPKIHFFPNYFRQGTDGSQRTIRKCFTRTYQGLRYVLWLNTRALSYNAAGRNAISKPSILDQSSLECNQHNSSSISSAKIISVWFVHLNQVWTT